jgi:peptidyl-prolyl cis-trans isomerase SurA
MKKFLLILSLCMMSVNYAQDVLDKIVAVVDNEIIMKSELDFQVNYMIAQKKLNPNNPDIQKQVLNSMIEEKLLYAQALIDSVTVTDEEINRQVEYQLTMLSQQYGSKEKIEQLYNMSYEKIKRELRENVKKESLIQRLQEKKFGLIDSGRRDVEEFYGRFKDSLGVIPEKVRLSHIFRNPKTSPELKQKYRAFAEAILDSIKHGSDFAEMAKKYSEDPGSAVQGGDLGFVKRGVFFTEYEAASFALAKDQLSPITESPAGFHIIQLLDRRGESVHTRHILIKVKSDEQNDLNTIEFLSSLRDSVIRGKGTFADFARTYSDDKETAPFGGTLGTLYLEQLDKHLLEVTSKLNEGDISFPKRVDYSQGTYGYHIVYMEKRLKQHQPDLDVDYADLKKLTDEYKKQKLYQNWMNEIKAKIYWEIKL